MHAVKPHRFFCLLLTLLMVFPLCGCSQIKFTTQAEFESAMEGCLDLSHYTYDPDSARYEAKEMDYVSPNDAIDFRVEFKGAQSISLPMSESKLRAAGWTKDKESSHVMYDTYSNSKGQSIIVNISKHNHVG